MVVLLKCQEELIESKPDSDCMKAFAIALICHLLDTFESDLTPDEIRDIDTFSKDWCKE